MLHSRELQSVQELQETTASVYVQKVSTEQYVVEQNTLNDVLFHFNHNLLRLSEDK